jgi:hypothetical protein
MVLFVIVPLRTLQGNGNQRYEVIDPVPSNCKVHHVKSAELPVNHNALRHHHHPIVAVLVHQVPDSSTC